MPLLDSFPASPFGKLLHPLDGYFLARHIQPLAHNVFECLYVGHREPW